MSAENTKKCTVYIDESGDLGIGRGTQWFILSAVIVNKDDENEIREVMKSLKAKLNINEIHFRNLRNFEQKCYVVSSLNSCNFDLVNVIIDTSKLTLNHTEANGAPSIVSYNYCCRMLLERVSWLLRDSNRIGDIVLSSRGTSRDKELIDYIQHKLIPYKGNSIEDKFLSIKSKSASEWDLLQLADVCATSIFYYYQPNKYGFITPCYSYRLKSHIYARGGKTNSYGIKYYATEMEPPKEYFISKMICK